MRTLLAVLMLSGMFSLCACEKREANEPQRNPGYFLLPGGDVR